MSLQKNLFQFRARLQPQAKLLAKCLSIARRMTDNTHIKKAGSYFAAIALTLLSVYSFAQTTTIQTTTYTGNGTGSGSPGTGITFVVHNTNSYDIIITGVGYSPHITTPIQLWYSSTSLTGATGLIGTPTWNMATQVTATSTVANTVIVDNFFPNLNVIVPANSTYRFACVSVGGTARYSAASSPSPVTWTAGGVTLDASTSLWGGSNNISNSGRYFFGSISFMPSCIGPTNPNVSNITVNSADFSWTGVSGSLGYEYAITSTPTPPASGTLTSATSASFSGLTLNTTYFVHVRNKCANSYSNWATTSFTTLNAYCLPPTNILFSNVTTISAEILWSLMPTTDWYEYIIDPIYYADPPSSLALSTTGITASATNLVPNSKYFVYVRSFCLGGNDSSWWKVDSFITKAQCGMPDVQIIVPGDEPQVEWAPIPDAVAYEYRLTNNTNPPAFGTETKNTNLTLSLPKDGTDQYLHVRSKCHSQFTFSNWSVTVLRGPQTSAINDIGKSSTIVSVYPNPVKDWLTIDVKNNSNAAIIMLTDIAGRIISTQQVNGNKIQIDMQGLSSGAYLLKYSSDTHNEIMRVNKL